MVGLIKSIRTIPVLITADVFFDMGGFVSFPALENVLNLRDLSSVAPRISPGCVFRSARLCDASAEDVMVLFDGLRIQTLVDLRTPQEIESTHIVDGPLQQALATRACVRHEISLLDPAKMRRAMGRKLPVGVRMKAGASLLVGGRARLMKAIAPTLNSIGLEGINEILLAQSGPALVTALRIIADPDCHPVVFSCTAGKDRTGLLAALILLLLGVDEASILRDYSRSHDHFDTFRFTPSYAGMLSETGLDPDVFLAAYPETMRHTLHHLNTHHGGVQQWLSTNGFGAVEQENLVRLLMKPSPD